MIRIVLLVLFVGILAAMLAVTTYASRDRSIFSVGPPLTSDPWFHATLADVATANCVTRKHNLRQV